MEDNPDLPLERFLATPTEFYILGDTCDRTARMLIGNHALDLRDYLVIRHWPPKDIDLTAEASHAIALDNMREAIQARMRAMMRAFPSAMPVTGGIDSRFLLACQGEETDLPRVYLPMSITRPRLLTA